MFKLFGGSLLDNLVQYFQTKLNQDILITFIIDMVVVLALVGFVLWFLYKYTHKKWLTISIIFFGFLFALCLFADLKILYSIFPYLVIAYLFVWIMYFIPNMRSLFDELTKPKNVKNFVNNEEAQNELIKILIDSVTHLSERRIGAIITIEKEDSLNTYIEKAPKLDSEISKELIDTIFMPGTALHDGAVIIRENRIMCAGAFYPTSETGSIPKTYGSRHRAALGISERSDAFTIVVSEETGNIAVTFDGTLTEKVSLEGLRVFLKQNIIVK